MNKAFVVKIIMKKPLNISLCMAILKKSDLMVLLDQITIRIKLLLYT